ncbi:pectate lyase-like adhesive domain-containing protein [uncultured Enterococcus sp.]|uniref:pectate lyase-like adhesive domain-containing protein n=1 Tax=uncultured Enterococcus sp. TaxID=167972 RepID=UPI002AA7B6A3|nr:pectate lyase-like adhesive domain-containing protein [uncultured Enterococcus sp.]
MKKTNILKKGILTLAATLALGAVATLGVEGVPFLAPQGVEAAAGTVQVGTVGEFEAALKDSNVNVIIVTSSISFNKNITDIPNRDVEIRGRKGQGVVINSGHFSIYGKQNTKGRNTLTIKNARIIGDSGDGRFFTGGAGNGPSSYGWDVVAQNVNYDGARFVHLSEGKLTFEGNNVINTRAENAWVHDLEFAADSVYTGTAANRDHSQFSAFYFNGALINGKATGEVTIGENAKVNVKIGPQSTVNYYYPVFYDKVDTVTLKPKAELNVDAAGVAFQFIPRADYKSGNPSLNLEEGSSANFNGRGGGNYAAMKLQYYNTEVNLDENSSLVVTGNSTKGVIESEYKGASINLENPKNFEVTNNKANSKLFYSTNTTINGFGTGEILAWNQRGAVYPEDQDYGFDGGNFSVSFGKLCNSQTLSTFGKGVKDIKLENYGKIQIGQGVN